MLWEFLVSPSHSVSSVQDRTCVAKPPCLDKMDTLSPELILKVIVNLNSICDLTNFRLVQRSFAELANQRTFDTVLVRPTRQSFCRFVQLSEAPNIARYVRLIVLNFDFIENMVMTSLENVLRRRPEFSLGDVQGDLSDFMEDIFREYYAFQVSPQYVGILEAVFKTLPGLKGFEIRKVTRSSWGDPWVVFGQPYSIHGTRISSIIEDAHGFFGERDHFRAFEAVVHAAHLAGIKLERFQVNALMDEIFFFRNNQLLQYAASVFRHCRVLFLEFGSASDDREKCNLVSQLEWNQLFSILSPAVSLKSICLTFSTHGGEPIAFSKVFGVSHVWCQLEEFEINGIDAKHLDLVGFFKRHRVTLRRVSISECRLSTGRWESVVQSMREHLNLVWLVFEGSLLDFDDTAYRSEEMEDMVDYVLGRSSTLPIYD